MKIKNKQQSWSGILLYRTMYGAIHTYSTLCTDMRVAAIHRESSRKEAFWAEWEKKKGTGWARRTHRRVRHATLKFKQWWTIHWSVPHSDKTKTILILQNINSTPPNIEQVDVKETNEKTQLWLPVDCETYPSRIIAQRCLWFQGITYFYSNKIVILSSPIDCKTYTSRIIAQPCLWFQGITYFYSNKIVILSQ